MALLKGGLSGSYPVGILASHAHDDCAQLVYAERGMMSFVTPGERWVLPPGRALWIPQGIVHQLEVRRPAAMRLLYLEPLAEGLTDWRRCRVMDVTPLLRELILHCVNLPVPQDPSSSEDRLVRVLLDQVARSTQAPVNLPEPSDPRALRLARMMREGPADRRPIEVLAREAGASARTLQRLFVEETGMPLGEWRNRLRLLLALERLAGGESVAAAAYAMGYENSSSFIAAFRELFGDTPRRYLART
ncbi:MAG: AraC family transcriptional regulator [Azospirillum brasilense]|nr:MAG: AraC family transcriptional regulator [Azospirillum brasilense]